MNDLKSCTFSWVYQYYLAWFADRAQPGAAPKSEEEIIGTYSYNEDIFDDGHITLSRVVHYVPLTSREAKSGKPELFGFTELNLIEERSDGEIAKIVPVEYTLL